MFPVKGILDVTSTWKIWKVPELFPNTTEIIRHILYLGRRPILFFVLKCLHCRWSIIKNKNYVNFTLCIVTIIFRVQCCTCLWSRFRAYFRDLWRISLGRILFVIIDTIIVAAVLIFVWVLMRCVGEAENPFLKSKTSFLKKIWDINLLSVLQPSNSLVYSLPVSVSNSR